MMKKLATAAMLGLFAIGCGEAPKPSPPMGDPAAGMKMPQMSAPPAQTPAAGSEEKKPEAPAEGEKPAAETPPADPK